MDLGFECYFLFAAFCGIFTGLQVTGLQVVTVLHQPGFTIRWQSTNASVRRGGGLHQGSAWSEAPASDDKGFQ